uniref:hypothetical protein n=1 Tax=Algoriphagus sp. TaxID=1872435 RepID=UPI0040471B16
METELDLALWLDKSIVIRQNQLKADFLDLFEQVGNSFSNEELTNFFGNSKGKKISKGNQLDGFPYLVLDLIRDFNLDSGCNIRLVSWFGHGLFCCAYFGKNRNHDPDLFLESGFQLGRADKPWDLKLQLEVLKATRPIPKIDSKSKLWIKHIALSTTKQQSLQILNEEVKNILKVKLN